MAKVEAQSIRPLSPHLQIFRSYVNMMMSIMHRITGTANYFGMLIPVVWLVAAAMGQQSFNTINGLYGSPLGLLVLFGYSWSLIHHAIGGIRHFVWDSGRAFSVGAVRVLSWGTIVLSLAITGALWFMVLTLLLTATTTGGVQ